MLKCQTELKHSEMGAAIGTEQKTRKLPHVLVTPGCMMMSVRPPAATATTGKPEAMASRATNPRVSVSLGIMKISALAYAADSSGPFSMPYTSIPPIMVLL